MIKFKKLKIQNEKHFISYKEFDDQMMAIYLGPKYEDNNFIEYNLGIAIADSKQQLKDWYINDIDTTGLVTGKQGLAPLYWAYDKLDSIEEYLNSMHKDKCVNISVQAEERKYKIYKRFLEKKGFTDYGNVLVKEI